MKTKQLLLLSVAVLCTSLSSAQIKVWSGGTITMGDVSSPSTSAKMHMVGNAAFAATNASSVTSAAYIRGSNAYSSYTTPDFTWWNNDQTGLFHPANNVLGFTVGGSERMRLHSNGYVGIGTNSPTELLHVAGTTRLNGAVTFDNAYDVFLDWSNGYCCGLPFLWPEVDWGMQIGDASHAVAIEYVYDLYYRGLHFYSDQSIKDNINYNDNSVSKLKQLKPVTFNYKASAFTTTISNVAATQAAKHHYGLIAQDLQAVFPDLVEKDPTSNLLTVNYIELIPIIIEGYIAQQNKIDSLQSQINNCCNSGNRLINPQGNNKGDNGGINNGGGSFGNNSGATFNGDASYIKQNVPNPFNKETRIDYFILEKNPDASVLIFDMNGKLLKTLRLSGSGNGSVTINGSDLQPGMYYYSLIVNQKEIDTKKMILTE